MTHQNSSDSQVVRDLLRRASAACLATRLPETGEPHASLVLLACDAMSRPVMLLSDLAVHSRNIAADPRVSLLIDETAGMRDRLAGTRASVQGTAGVVSDDALLQGFLRRHPEAADYAGFADFRLYRVEVARAHLVAGFGRIAWVDGAEIVGVGDDPERCATEPPRAAGRSPGAESGRRGGEGRANGASDEDT